MNKNSIRLTEDECIDAIHSYLTGCDADELARLVGECFGGDCYYLPKSNDDLSYDYEFIPNEFYMNSILVILGRNINIGKPDNTFIRCTKIEFYDYMALINHYRSAWADGVEYRQIGTNKTIGYNMKYERNDFNKNVPCDSYYLLKNTK